MGANALSTPSREAAIVTEATVPSRCEIGTFETTTT